MVFPPAIDISPEETLETLPGSRLKIIQKKSGYRYSVDALLVAEFTRVSPGDRIIDLGTGSGVVALVLAEKARPGEMVAVEVQPDLADLALRNVALNGMGNLITVVNKDIKDYRDNDLAGRYDVAVSNPPFRAPGRGRVSPKAAKAQARHELSISLTQLVASASYLLKPGGRFSLVYTAARLVELICELRNQGLEPKRMQLIHHRVTAPAQLVLIEAIKGAGVELNIHPPRILEQ